MRVNGPEHYEGPDWIDRVTVSPFKMFLVWVSLWLAGLIAIITLGRLFWWGVRSVIQVSAWVMM